MLGGREWTGADSVPGFIAFSHPTMADAGFMILHDRISEAQLTEALGQMKPIELVELCDAFARARPIVLNLARTAS